MTKKAKNKLQTPKAGDLIEITARHCGEKVSPLLQVGKRFIVKETATLGKSDDTLVLVLCHPTRKKATLRANALRFEWRIITPEILKAEALAREVAKDAGRLMSDFTREEQIDIAFVPLIFNHIAWFYAMKAVQISVDERISILKKVTRGIRKLRNDYENEISKDLDRNHIKHIEDETERFISLFQNDFTILYFTVDREFLKRMPDYPYIELRCYAIISMLFIRYVDAHNKRMDALIASRLGKCNASIRMPIMDALYSCMDAYAGEIDSFDYDNIDIQRCMRIFQNNVSKIEFDVI